MAKEGTLWQFAIIKIRSNHVRTLISLALRRHNKCLASMQHFRDPVVKMYQYVQGRTCLDSNSTRTTVRCRLKRILLSHLISPKNCTPFHKKRSDPITTDYSTADENKNDRKQLRIVTGLTTDLP